MKNNKLVRAIFLCIILGAGSSCFTVNALADETDTLQPTCQDGYYGYANQNGEIVIDFYFTEAEEFTDSGYAIVKNEKTYGVIDESGNYVVAPKYSWLSWVNEYYCSILEFMPSGVGSNALGSVGACTIDGAEIIPAEYADITIHGDYLLAEIFEMSGERYVGSSGRNIGDQTAYCAYDLNGNLMFGEGTALENGIGVVIDGPGINRLRCTGKSWTNSHGYAYDTNSMSDWYCYVDEDFSVVAEGPYETVQPYNYNGYAVANCRTTDGEKVWVVLDQEGEELLELPELTQGRAGNAYTETNGYYAIAGGWTGSTFMVTDTYTAIVNVKTKEIVNCESAFLVPMSDYMIVQDKETLLYGLYEGEELVLDYLYDDIENIDDQIILFRGNTSEVYTVLPWAEYGFW